MEKLRRLSIMLPIQVHTQFKLKCVGDAVLMSDVVREMLEQKLGQREKKKTAKTAKIARNEVQAA
jgi:hypothetical protein